VSVELLPAPRVRVTDAFRWVIAALVTVAAARTAITLLDIEGMRASHALVVAAPGQIVLVLIDVMAAASLIAGPDGLRRWALVTTAWRGFVLVMDRLALAAAGLPVFVDRIEWLELFVGAIAAITMVLAGTSLWTRPRRSVLRLSLAFGVLLLGLASAAQLRTATRFRQVAPALWHAYVSQGRATAVTWLRLVPWVVLAVVVLMARVHRHAIAHAIAAGLISGSAAAGELLVALLENRTVPGLVLYGRGMLAFAVFVLGLFWWGRTRSDRLDEPPPLVPTTAI
jgi:hypothetical protein